MYTIDASVYINASDTRETDHQTSEHFLYLIQTRHIHIVVPTLVLTEVAAAIGRGRGDATLAMNFAQRISQFPNVTFRDLSVLSALESATIAANYRLRGADAVYVAVALNAQTILVTRDQEQINRVQNLIRVCSPAEAIAEIG